MPTDRKSQPPKRARWFIVAWLTLLLLSTLVRWQLPEPGLRPGQEFVMLPPMEADGAVSGNPVRMAFRDSNPTGNAVPLVLIHGSPAASSFMMPLHEALTADSATRVITPDMPGFEGSARRIPDYSIRAHAAYLGAFLDSLDLDRVHLAGYSMGSGVAIEAMRQWPDRIASVVLLAGIGVQEMELLGDYHLNRGIHGLQLAAISGATNLLPHFGLLDNLILGIPYARNFYDSDQRPLRGVLSAWEKPLLLLHGDADHFVPAAAGLEHHRIVPQSRLILYEGVGHGLVKTQPERISQDIQAFLSDVDTEAAQTRSGASTERLSEASKPFRPSDIPPASGSSLFVLAFLIAISTLVSEDLASISAGLMAARGIMPLGWAVGGAFAGILVGDIGLYVMGRVLGRRVVAVPPFSWFVSAGALDRGARWFKKRGARVIVASRFIPGTRFPTYVAAGIIKAPFWPFMGYFILGTLLWTPVIVGISMLMGEQILLFWETYESIALWVLLGVVLTLYLVIHVGMPLFTYRGRRLWLSRWRRWTRWEFWPAWLFYPPVLWRVLRLMIEYRSATVFTAANPGMDSGGFVGESKVDTFALLPSDSDMVARWVSVDPLSFDSSQALQAHTLSCLSDREMYLPLVLKPDVGERGHGVHIVRTQDELTDALTTYPARFIIQEYVAGEEFGLFYVRHPGQENGSILSITHKILPSVNGNGRDTLERLILSDDRAVCMAPTFLSRHAAQLDRIPNAGERINLVSVGTHARGAEFRDGNALLTPALTEALDHVARRMDGFFFGRFDVRVPSVRALQEGLDIRILEINGVTSEATHIYDPSTPRQEAIRVLGEQWRLAFEIGCANAELGNRPTSLRTLIQLIITWKIRPSFRPDTRMAAEWHLHADHPAKRTNESLS